MSKAVSFGTDCPVCDRQFETQRGAKTHYGVKHQDDIKERIIELFIRQNMSAREVAEEMGLSLVTVQTQISRFNLNGKDPTEFRLEPDWGKYPVWTHTGTGHRLRVHRLVVIADGADPHKVFSGDYDVDHLNNSPLDNRPENLELVDHREHGRRHKTRRNRPYKHKDLLYLLHLALDATPFAQTSH